MKVLVCGGAGYIGSHTCVTLLDRGYDVVIYDNLVNSSQVVVDRVSELSGATVHFVRGDIRDQDALVSLLRDGVDAVIHFAALKVASDSCQRPLIYFENNIAGTITLLRAMLSAGVKNLVCSSSATVYGEPDAVPISENAPLRASTPYGLTKLVMEQLIGELCKADPEFSAVLLRYFNPAGAHPSGHIGEDPNGAPGNLLPYVAQVAIGLRHRLDIFGNDYPTRDGTGIRDYIHVMDLADAHVKALQKIGQGGCAALNLGGGQGYSVLEVVSAFERASGRRVPYQFVARRAGDVAEAWADPSRAETTLGWHARYDLRIMCEDAWRWQSGHPHGYQS
jgi:UDP-glucose 4-epimerase